MNDHAPIVTLDGPGGSGKGTIAQALARELDWHYLESGALYRVLGLLAARNEIALDDVEALTALAAQLELTFRDGVVWHRGAAIGDEIRTPQAAERAARVAVLPTVRDVLKAWQRNCARPPGLVADGRDLGTVVFPQAACKIYLTADARARAERRQQQLKRQGINVNIDSLLAEICARDERDSNRAASPLKRPRDAFELDTTDLDVQQTLTLALARVKSACGLD